MYEAIEIKIQSVLGSIQTTLDAYPNLSTDNTEIFNKITEYKTSYTTKLATYKTKKEGYQTDYNQSCGTTTKKTSTVGPSTTPYGTTKSELTERSTQTGQTSSILAQETTVTMRTTPINGPSTTSFISNIFSINYNA